jgi:hypothetical protein
MLLVGGFGLDMMHHEMQRNPRSWPWQTVQFLPPLILINR